MHTNEPKWLWEGQTVHWEQLAHLLNTPGATRNVRLPRFAAKTRMVELMLEWLDTPPGAQWRNHVSGAVTARMLMARASEVFGWGLGKPPTSKARMLSRPQVKRMGSMNELLGDLG